MRKFSRYGQMQFCFYEQTTLGYSSALSFVIVAHIIDYYGGNLFHKIGLYLGQYRGAGTAATGEQLLKTGQLKICSIKKEAPATRAVRAGLAQPPRETVAEPRHHSGTDAAIHLWQALPSAKSTITTTTTTTTANHAHVIYNDNVCHTARVTSR